MGILIAGSAIRLRQIGYAQHAFDHTIKNVLGPKEQHNQMLVIDAICASEWIQQKKTIPKGMFDRFNLIQNESLSYKFGIEFY